jgi:hypothetical protein
MAISVHIILFCFWIFISLEVANSLWAYCSTPVYSPSDFTSDEVYTKVLDLQDKVSKCRHTINICTTVSRFSMQQCNGCSFIMQVPSVNRIPKPNPRLRRNLQKKSLLALGKLPLQNLRPLRLNPLKNLRTLKVQKRISLHPSLTIQNLNLTTSCE